MRVNILKYVIFSIIICSFEYSQNELCLGRNVINFRNNRVLTDVDNLLDLNDLSQSTVNLVNQFDENDSDDDGIIYMRKIINSHIKEQTKNNTLPKLSSLNKRTKKIVNKLLTELEKAKKELSSHKDDEMKKKLIEDEQMTIKDENFKQFENELSPLEKENMIKDWEQAKKDFKGMMISGTTVIFLLMGLLIPGPSQIPISILISLLAVNAFYKGYKYDKFQLKALKALKKVNSIAA
ncbi:hypothetical protein YYC_03526, partial [Plasmodium yoelii 17X]|uniref:Fam-b protein n=4 Tax=Plasmodium yoelii TaxID=5861 RepID=A0AAE9WK22_PLAYO|eukprot:XP_723690.2 fam-b protein [Plasmodium yoelii]